jgi:hypothetical protein
MLLQVTNIVITLLTFTVISSNVIIMFVESKLSVDISTDEDFLTCLTISEKIHFLIIKECSSISHQLHEIPSILPRKRETTFR